MASNNILYAQSGGVTPVINATACGVIQTVRTNGQGLGRVLAARDGIIGALQEDLIDTTAMSDGEVAALRHTPGGAFGSCRYKLGSVEDNQEEFRRLAEVFRAHDIGYFFYNGGGDSADTALKISRMGDAFGHPVRCIGLPKTIDNDLMVTDTCPGFGSVAKYVAVSITEASLDVKSMASSSTKVFIMEVMGRHAGWIAAAGGLACRKSGDAPQVILFPEIPFDEDAFCKAVDESVKANGYCSVVVSEGLRDSAGKLLADAGTQDAFGHKQLGGVALVLAGIVRENLGYKYHWAVCDYLQRSARHIASKTDVEQAWAVGRGAVELALAGHDGVLAAIRRISADPYRWDIVPVPLSEVANQEKKMPRAFIDPDGFGITDACREYMAPLIQGEDYPPYRDDGLPDYIQPEFELVERKLPEYRV